MPPHPSSIVPQPISTVSGPVPYEGLGITDAHNHVWIEAVDATGAGNPVLNQYDPILKELIEYRQAGGATILDCQPAGCGRDGRRLLNLSNASHVNIIACTGFHRQKYYPPGFWLWQASVQKVYDFLSSELEQGLGETVNTSHPVRAGFIKIALEESWSACPMAALEGAAMAANSLHAVLEIHTEKGALAEKACIYFLDRGVLPRQLVLCHMDKRPDFTLHKALANLDVMLEYDTFYRPKYDPDANLWPLLDQVINAGFSDRVALATDMAESALYHNLGGGPGLASLPGEIRRKLAEKGYPETVRMQLLGGNIARRLAGLP